MVTWLLCSALFGCCNDNRLYGLPRGTLLILTAHYKNCSQISRIMLQCQWILICNDFCGATLLQLLSYLAATFTEAARFLVTALVFYQVWGKIRVCLKTGYNQNWPFDWRHCDWQIELEVINYPVCRRTYVVQISVERGIDDLQIWTLLHIDSDYLYIYICIIYASPDRLLDRHTDQLTNRQTDRPTDKNGWLYYNLVVHIIHSITDTLLILEM